MTQAFPPEDGTGLSMRNLTHLIYGLFALGLLSAGFFGVATIAAVVLAYLKRGDAAGTLYAAHFDWVIKTFWWGLLWILISAVFTFIFIGWVTGLIAIVWIVYRVIKGWLALFSAQSPLAD
ncbi:DUF4870 family protein [Parapusillimonas granuli]|uniref:Transmembrane protein n=1 Tax=Parapusillimonas granuli TaxID=380911 RepID=A0A853FX73_9BURK|nr:hypothetical protein [Parapusillimonas granuli]MBB5213902.1 putative membrane protein [Parapusillimonas granuli]MEB2398981.1 hypothetical protein [Alcaligenaceae bacterium]NYT48737.1 hypothetical protein [Parapusillimonas granuli]